MRCMMLVKSDAKTEEGKMPDDAAMAEMGKFNEQMKAAGVLVAGEGLHPSSKGARVRLGNGKFTVQDGPFAEAKELIAGYWVIQTKSLLEARDWLARVPALGDDQVELRPIYELEDFPVDPAEQAGGWRDQEAAARDASALKAPARKPGTKRFILLLKADALSEAGAPPKEEVLAKMGELMEEGVRTGTLLGGEGLKPSSTGARLRVKGGKRTTVDGPFTESKELIAGYVVLQLPSLDEAVEFAKRWLAVHALVGVAEGEIEVRELMEFDHLPAVSNR